MTKKCWFLLGSTLLLLGALACTYNFKADRQRVRSMLAHAHNGDVSRTLQAMEESPYLTNPLLNVIFQYKKRQYVSRFVHQDERFAPVSDHPQIQAIAELFRRYWNDKLTGSGGLSDDDLLAQLALLLSEADQAYEDTPDGIFAGVVDLIESEGLYAAVFHLNSNYGLKIWEHQTLETHRVELPEETIEVEVVHIDSYLLAGLNSYATLETFSDGGWVTADQRVYCNTDAYDFESEGFLISFLKHEGQHYVDVGHHPNLSSADMEYRAKLVELMYSTNANIYSVLDGFLSNAHTDDRAAAHGYANHTLIVNLSKMLFDEDVVTESQRWRQVGHPQINAAARELYEQSQTLLAVDPMGADFI